MTLSGLFDDSVQCEYDIYVIAAGNLVPPGTEFIGMVGAKYVFVSGEKSQ
jgi:hypothetical protein